MHANLVDADQSHRAGGTLRPSGLAIRQVRGFRAAADTVRGRLISRNGNRMRRFEEVLDRLPKGHVFDGELVVLDDAGRPLFNELVFGRRRPTFVALASSWKCENRSNKPNEMRLAYQIAGSR
jgi:hypothetical protein